MNELSQQNKQLPDNLPDLSRFVLIGREKLNAVRAEIRAIDKVGLAQEVHQQKLQEAQEIAEAVLDAEVQIGKLTAAIPKASGGDRKSKNFKNDTVVDFEKPKSEALEEIGIHQKQAERFERIAKYPEAVEKAKEEARQEGRIVTRQNVLDEIHDMTWGKDKSPRQLHKEFIESVKQEREEFKEQNSDGVVSIKDVAQDRENASMLAMELWSRLAKMGKPISDMYLEFKENEIDIKEMVKVLPHSDIASLTSRIQMWQTQLNIFMEEITN